MSSTRYLAAAASRDVARELQAWLRSRALAPYPWHSAGGFFPRCRTRLVRFLLKLLADGVPRRRRGWC